MYKHIFLQILLYSSVFSNHVFEAASKLNKKPRALKPGDAPGNVLDGLLLRGQI